MSAPSTTQLLEWPGIEAVLRGSRLTLLYGPPGTGKTTAAVNAGKALGVSVWNLTVTEETPAAELRGHYLPKGTEWLWQDGPALAAYRNGGMLILNEISHASGDALTFLHGLLDDGGTAAVTLPTGETVFPHADFRACATMNEGLEDFQTDRPALADRFAVALYIDTPHPDAIAALPDDLRDAASGSAGRDIDLERPATLRRWKALGSLRETVDGETAMTAVFGHRASEIRDALTLRASR